MATIIKANKAYFIELKYPKFNVVVKLSRLQNVVTNHMISRSWNISEEDDYKIAALEVSKHRFFDLGLGAEDRFENTVFEPCSRFFRMEIGDKSHPFLFENEEELIVSFKPLSTFQCTKEVGSDWKCVYVGQRYACFKATFPYHFLEKSLQLSCQNVIRNM